MCTPALREDQNYKGLINWLAALESADHCEVYDTKILEFIERDLKHAVLFLQVATLWNTQQSRAR